MATTTAEAGADYALAHHFDDLEQQRRAGRQGMWLFLVTEVLFFGGLFAAYTVYRMWYAPEFKAASSHLNVLIAAINSVILLVSSLTMTLAVVEARAGNRQALVRWLAISAGLGVLFLGFKAREYYLDVQEKLVPGPPGWAYFDATRFSGEPHDVKPDVSGASGKPTAHVGAHADHGTHRLNPNRVQLFLIFYYVMTGLHVLHLIAGVGVIVVLMFRASWGLIPAASWVEVELASLYWHFVDLMWLFLVPLLYLAGTHSVSHLHL